MIAIAISSDIKVGKRVDSMKRPRNPLGTRAVVLILAFVFCLLNFHQSSAEEQNETKIKDWQLISSSTTTASGPGVDTYMKSYPGTQLSAFRGVGTLDIHISVAMGLFCDFNLAYEWVAMLESIKKYPRNGTVTGDSDLSVPLAQYGDCIPQGGRDIVHQTLKIPWPISPREIVLERNFVYIPPNILQKGAENSESQVASDIDVDGGSDVLIPKFNTQEALPSEDVPEVGGIIIINYHSVLDDRIPMHPGRVRAESPLTMWRFQDVTHRERALRGSDQDMSVRYTEIEVQVLVDSKGYIPVWFINSIQRLWPARAMSAFNKLIKKNNPSKKIEKSQACSSLSYLTACSEGVQPFQPVAHW